MKKFTKILICLLLCVFSFSFVACDKRTDEEKRFTYPSIGDRVDGNGGLAVKKGNYVYFVNGYNSIDNATSKKQTFTVGSLMLMKLGENGEVVRDENGLLKDEYFITMSDKLCGYQATNLYIHGEYLYFATPCLENESGDKVWAKERVEFKRIKLDKTGKVEDVYSSGVKYDQLEYKYYEENGELFILVWEKGDSYYSNKGTNAIVRVNATSKSSNKVTDSVLSVAFADNANEIFFVANHDDRYYLKHYNIATNDLVNYHAENETFEVKFVANGKVFITMAHPYGSTTDIKSSVIDSADGFVHLYAYEGEVDLSITDDGHVVLVSGNKISVVKDVNEAVVIEDADATKISVIDNTNGCILYYDTKDENSTIKLVSYSNALTNKAYEIETLTTISAVEEDYEYFDFNDGDNHLYFYQLEGNNYYLNRLKVNNNFGETHEMFGKYLEEDIPEVEEDTEETDENEEE